MLKAVYQDAMETIYIVCPMLGDDAENIMYDMFLRKETEIDHAVKWKILLHANYSFFFIHVSYVRRSWLSL